MQKGLSKLTPESSETTSESSEATSESSETTSESSEMTSDGYFSGSCSDVIVHYQWFKSLIPPTVMPATKAGPHCREGIKIIPLLTDHPAGW